MVRRINLGDIAVDVIQKGIKNIHLSVHPPTGKVRIAAPLRMDVDTIRVFAISKLGWIKKQQDKLRRQEREVPREYLDRESHYYLGKRYLLKVVEEDAAPRVELKHATMVLYVRPGADEDKKQSIVDEWYRRQLKEETQPLVAKWQRRLGVSVERFSIRKMKTMWGSCTPKSKAILLNLELAKKPPACLEYIVVHELVHLLEPTHNSRFVALMDRFLPQWRFHREELNRLPVRHEQWRY